MHGWTLPRSLLTKLYTHFFLLNVILLPGIICGVDDPGYLEDKLGFIIYLKDSNLGARAKYVREDSNSIYVEVHGVSVRLKKVLLDFKRMKKLNPNWQPENEITIPKAVAQQNTPKSGKIYTNRDISGSDSGGSPPDVRIRIGLVEKYLSLQWQIAENKALILSGKVKPDHQLKSLQDELEWVETELGISDDVEKLELIRERDQLIAESQRAQQDFVNRPKDISQEEYQKLFQRLADLAKRLDQVNKKLEQKHATKPK